MGVEASNGDSLRASVGNDVAGSNIVGSKDVDYTQANIGNNANGNAVGREIQQNTTNISFNNPLDAIIYGQARITENIDERFFRIEESIVILRTDSAQLKEKLTYHPTWVQILVIIVAVMALAIIVLLVMFIYVFNQGHIMFVDPHLIDPNIVLGK